MNFDWDNKHNIIGHWIPTLAGEYIIRCLGFSSRLAIPYHDRFPSTPGEKLDELRNQSPEFNDRWHKKFPQSISWLKYAEYIWDARMHEDIWEGAHLASREYFDRYFDRKKLSNLKGHGIVFQTHTVSQVMGLKHLMPQAKVFTIADHPHWSSLREFLDIDCVPRMLAHEKYLRRQDNGDFFEFDLDQIFYSTETAYLDHVRQAYQYFDLDDFERVTAQLVEWRKLYLYWNVNLKSENQLIKISH